MVKPILLYNSEVWVAYKIKQHQNAWDRLPFEKTHLKFGEKCLRVKSKTSNLATKAELGMIRVSKMVLK